MFELWAVGVVGWPAISLSLGLTAVGILYKHPWPVVAGAAAMTPFALYLAGMPGFGVMGLLLPALLLAAAYSVAKERTVVPWVCVAPVLAVVGWLAVAVATQ